MEWSIQDLARSAGTTSRTLRHYGDVGLLTPSRVGSNGYRYYDQESLVRLQRILLLRELGLGLPAIAEVLEGQRDTASALRTHLVLLKQERQRLGRQIESVRTTLRKTEGGEQLVAEEVFDGFDHTQYEQEVTERWGREAYEQGDRWWRSLTDADEGVLHLSGPDVRRRPPLHGELRPARGRDRRVHPGRDEGLRRAQSLAPDRRAGLQTCSTATRYRFLCQYRADARKPNRLT